MRCYLHERRHYIELRFFCCIVIYTLRRHRTEKGSTMLPLGATLLAIVTRLRPHPISLPKSATHPIETIDKMCQTASESRVTRRMYRVCKIPTRCLLSITATKCVSWGKSVRVYGLIKAACLVQYCCSGLHENLGLVFSY